MKPAQAITAEAVGIPATRTRSRTSSPEVRLVRAIWHMFISMRLALVLILAIAAVVLAGTLIDQAPGAVLADPAARSRWLDIARVKYGLWTDVFYRTGMFNVFHSFWFRGLIALLALNIVVCSIHRWKGIWNIAFRTRVRMADEFFVHARHNSVIETSVPVEQAATLARRALSRAHFHVSVDAAPESVALFADRNRLSRFGTFFSHLGLVLILLGAAAGSLWGKSDPGFVVPEGATRSLGMGTTASIKLEHFADEYYLDGPPKDFRSDVVIYEGSREVKRGTIRVNSPMSYDGVRIHQAFYGQTAVMNVRDKTGAVVFHDSVPLAWQTTSGNRPVGSFTIPGKAVTAYVIGPWSGENDPLIPAGEMRVETYRADGTPLAPADVLVQGQPKQLDAFEFTFERESRFAGLKLKKDPGVNIIWIASAFMVLGMVMLFYLPRRRMWVLCKRGPGGSTEVRMAMPSQRDTTLADEFERLRKKVALAIETPGAKDQGSKGD